MIDIRFGAEGDAAALTHIAYTAKRHWGYPQSWIGMWQEELTVTAQYVAMNPVYVAEYDNAIVGFVGLDVYGTEAEIDHLWVLPKHMGQGFGQLLLQRALRHCALAGLKQLRVVSDPHAKGFYYRLGGIHRGEIDSTPAPRTLPVLYFNVPVVRISEKEED